METVNDTESPTGTPPPGSPPLGRRPERLTRSTGDKVVAGVAGGLGNYFGIDPVVFRIAFVVLALAGGSGLLLYLLAWLVVPDDAGHAALSRFGHERNQKLLAAVLAGGGLLILLDRLNTRGSDIPVGLVLVGIGALVLWSRRDHDGGDDHRPGPPPPVAPRPQAEPGEPVEAIQPVEPTASFAATTETVPPLAPPPARVKKPKPRSVLVPVTLSLLAILAGGLGLVGVSATTGVALALLVTGVALMVGAWRGRAKWLIPLGLVLAVALAAASVIDVPVRGGSGDVTFRPLTVSDVHTPYRLAAGNLVVDLSALHLDGATLTVVASVAAGHLDVIVPAGAAVQVDAHAGAGDLDLLGRHWDGLDVGRQVSDPGAPDAGLLVLRPRVGAGGVEVRRAAA
ncbi:MAG TPA: PspC domain-containing protein [Acidimicrobiales bacterium]|nr:PspC domain-containing protein [Acidimicrobiales bacterium]